MSFRHADLVLASHAGEVYRACSAANNYEVIGTLRHPPYVGKSFISNNYAAPLAEGTQQWAYIHAGAAQGRIAFDDTYLWFADKRVNPAYRRPQYFMCFLAPSLPLAVYGIRQRLAGDAGPAGCTEHALVKRAAGEGAADDTPPVVLMETDQEGKHRLGYARWAIVKLLWDAEPSAGK